MNGTPNDTAQNPQPSVRRDEFPRTASAIIHEMNNVLTVIQNFAGFAAASVPANATLREDLQEIITAGERAIRLVQELRSLNAGRNPDRVTEASGFSGLI
jgi:signal transduction histidine kinase